MAGIIGTFRGNRTYCLTPEQYYSNREYYDTQDCYWLFKDKLLIVQYGKVIAKIDFIPCQVGISSGCEDIDFVNVDEYYPGLALQVKVKSKLKTAIAVHIDDKYGQRLMNELKGINDDGKDVNAHPWSVATHK